MADVVRPVLGWIAQRWRFFLWGGLAGLVLLPLIAMQFTSEVKWDGADFVFAILILGAVGLAFEVVARRAVRPAHRVALGAGIVAVATLIWADAAVGIF